MVPADGVFRQVSPGTKVQESLHPVSPRGAAWVLPSLPGGRATVTVPEPLITGAVILSQQRPDHRILAPPPRKTLGQWSAGSGAEAGVTSRRNAEGARVPLSSHRKEYQLAGLLGALVVHKTRVGRAASRCSGSAFSVGSAVRVRGRLLGP